ncbi:MULTISPECIES: HNH endonuclease signature motif containing protein [Pseudomonas]|uniref:HNH endonuclease signature motif containing protein n=1 Tax=Pseudomonas TaxID=286 RepID=UPI0023610B52|nr:MULTISPECIES: HNH endonuclease signature motif containing protein [Pseudomonas]WJV21678.1 HNH endonuclease signature motif containing protein [Pseudomonas chlororaphis]
MSPTAEQALQRARTRAVDASTQKATTNRRFWTTAEETLLRSLYPNTPMPELMVQIGRPKAAIYGKAKELGLKRSEAFLASEHSGRLRHDGNPGEATRFKKGHGTWNKGKPFSAGGRSAETQFSGGHVPHNHVPVGTEVMATDGYLKIKVAEPNTWEWTHRRNWQAVHGPIPAGHLLVFRNRDHTNCNVDNLELITRGELMRRNTIHRYPEELKTTIRQLSRLKRAIEAAHE